MNVIAPQQKIFAYAREIYALLDGGQRRQGAWLFAFMVMRAMVETGSVALIAFYAAAISDPRSVLKTPYIAVTREWFGWPPSNDIKSFILWLSIAVVASILLKNILSGRLIFRISRFSADLEVSFGHRLLTDFLHRDYQWHLGRNSADIIQTMQWRVYLGRFFVTPALKIVSETVVLFTLAITLILIQPVISMLFFLGQGTISLLFYQRLRKNLDAKSEQCKERERSINRQVTKAVHGYKDVKISGSEARFIDDFERQASPFARDFSWQQFWREAPLLTLETLGFLLVCGTILFMLYVLRYSPLEITGTTALLAVTAWRSLPSANRILGGMTSIRTGLPYVRNVLNEIDAARGACRSAANNPAPSLSFSREIVIDSVGFNYVAQPGHQVLGNIRLTIPRGKAIGIMGASGCGKSTLVDLLIGLLRPTAGRIVVDGVPLEPDKFRAWVQKIGYVSQSPYIFDGTLAENVAFGVPAEEISGERVRECCRLAAVDFLDELPAGIDSRIGERGVRLSGGQRQRVAIARALYRDPELLIFDEATSALDVENDRRIRSLIGELRGERTLVVVAHRESTLEMCDLVYSFDEDGQLKVVCKQEATDAGC